MEYAMPYFIQVARELTHKVEHVQKKHEEREIKEEKQAKAQMNQPLDVVGDMMMGGMPGLQGLNPGIPMLTMGGPFMGGADPMGGMGMAPGMPGMGGMGMGGMVPNMGPGFGGANLGPGFGGMGGPGQGRPF